MVIDGHIPHLSLEICIKQQRSDILSRLYLMFQKMTMKQKT